MKLGEAYVEIYADQTKLTAGLKKAQKNVGASMKAVGKSMTIAGAAIVAGFGMAIKTAAKFEKSMALTASVASATSEELKELSDYARKMGEQSVFSASQAADGMYYLASAGMNVNEVMGALEGTLALAAATQSDLAYTSESVASALSQFSLDADEATRVANVYAAAISGSQATMEKLTISMSYVGPMAKSMGMTIEDTTGILMGLYNAGIPASTAGTALRMAFVKLIEPTTKGAAALDRLKVSVVDSSGAMRPFKDIIDDLGEAGMTTADAMAIFGIRSGPAMMALVSQGTGAIQENVDAITDTEKAYEMAAMQIDTFEGAMKLLRSAFEELQITLVQDLMPSLKGMIEKITEGIKKVSDWMKENPKLTETIVKWGAAIGAALLVLGPLLIILPGIITALGLLKIAFIPFLIGGAIILGLAKLSEYLGDIKEKAFEVATGFKDWDLDRLSTGISEVEKIIVKLEAELKEAEKGFTLFGITLKNQDVNIGRLKQVIKDYRIELGLLKEQRERLTRALVGGADVTKELTEIDKAMIAQQESLNKILEEYAEGLEDIPGEIEEVLKGSALLSAQISLLRTEYENSNKTLEDTQEYYKGMVGLLEEYIEQLKVEIEKEKESTPTWFAKNEELLKAVGLYGEVKEAIEELNRVQDLQLTGLELTRAKLELLEERYKEVEKGAGYYKEKLELLKEEHELLAKNLDNVIEKYGEGTEEYYRALVAIEANINEMKKWWKEIDKGAETIDEFAQSFVDKMLMMKVAVEDFEPPDIGPWKEFFDDLKDEVGDLTSIFQKAAKTIWDGFSDAISDAITSFLTMAETNAKILEDMAEAEADYFDELADLQKDYAKIVSDINKKMAKEKEDYYDDLIALELSYERKVSDGIKDLTRENEDYDIDMRRLKEKRDEAAMNGDDKRAKYYQEKMDDCTLAHKRAVEDMEEKQAELTEDHKIKLDEMEEDHKEAMDALIKKKDEEAQNAKDEIKEVKDKYEELMTKMEDDMVTVGSISDTFWDTMKTAGVSALSALITQLIQYVALWLIGLGPVGWAILLGAVAVGAIWLQYSKAVGGEIEKLFKGGAMKGYQVGGGTDTVPAMLTPGEYVISKPMVDFIKRTGAVTSDLVSAIGSGARTPVPAFATGGSVSNPISSTYNQQRSYAVNIQPGAIQIITPKFGEGDAQEMFRLIERQARMRGLVFGRV